MARTSGKIGKGMSEVFTLHFSRRANQVIVTPALKFSPEEPCLGR